MPPILTLNPHEICVLPNRQRSELNLEDPEDNILLSIKEKGQLQPILIRRNPNSNAPFILIAGERRLEVCKKLGINVEAKLILISDNLESEEIEYEENRRRKNLPWRDEVRAISKLHSLYLSRVPEWKPDQTAQKLALSSNTIRNALLIMENISSPLLLSASSISQAAEILKRFSQEKTKLLSETLTETSKDNIENFLPKRSKTPSFDINIHKQQSPKEIALNLVQKQRYFDWLSKNREKRFDLIHLNFLEKTPEEQEEIFYNSGYLLDTNLIIWSDDYSLIKNSFLDHEILYPPIIWYKSDLRISNCYESGLIVFKPGINLNQKPCIFPCPAAKFKPIPLLKYFVSFFPINENFSFFDPFSQVGNSLLAARELGIKNIFGLEEDENLCRIANERLNKS